MFAQHEEEVELSEEVMHLQPKRNPSMRRYMAPPIAALTCTAAWHSHALWLVLIVPQVLGELAKREAAMSEEIRQREEAAALIQALVRRRKTVRAFNMLLRLARAANLVAKVIRRRRRRARRRAALCVQARLRAYICHTRGICSFNTIMLIIKCSAHTFSLHPVDTPSPYTPWRITLDPSSVRSLSCLFPSFHPWARGSISCPVLLGTRRRCLH